MAQNIRQWKPRAGILLQQPLDKVTNTQRHGRWKLELRCKNVGDQQDVVCALEWWPAHHHFIQEHAQAPDIQSLVMASPLNHLWCKVVQRAAKGCPRDASEGTPSQVRNLEYIITVDKKVFRLQISVNNALRM